MSAEFERIFAAAEKAGMAAGTNSVPRPMVVTGGGYREVVNDGPCGFAWVVVKPGTSRFAKWLKKTDKADKAYEGGVSIWIGAHNQSITRKEAHARAMAEVLKKEFPELKIWSSSRLD